MVNREKTCDLCEHGYIDTYSYESMCKAYPKEQVHRVIGVSKSYSKCYTVIDQCDEEGKFKPIISTIDKVMDKIIDYENTIKLSGLFLLGVITVAFPLIGILIVISAISIYISHWLDR